MAVINTQDGLVSLYLDGELKLEQAAISGVNIGTYIEYEDEEVEKKDYDTAIVGKDASFTVIEVFADGFITVEPGGIISNINITGGTLTGSPVCGNAIGWYGAGICMSSADYTQDGPGAVLLTGGTFFNCSVSPLNGYTGHGSAIETYGGTLSAADCLFVGNSANDFKAAGGAMALMYSTSTVTGGTFSGNTAYFGGAIQQNAGSLTVTDVFFANNATAGEASGGFMPGGGALEIHNGATAAVSGSTFGGNTAYAGGAIYNDTFGSAVCDVSVEASVFDANAADYQGGAIYNYAVMTVSESVFTGNMVVETGMNSWTSYGGAVANTKNGAMDVEGGTFSANSAVQGGAIATFIDYGSSDTADLTVCGAEFAGNTATYGGGIYIQTGTADETTILDSVFSGNTASYGGGAICRCYGAMTVTGGTFSENSAGNDGGAIAVWDSWDKTTSISEAEFDSNTALYGGAISHSWANSPLTVTDCTFIGNSAVYVPDESVPEPETVPAAQGGAIWNDSFSSGAVTISGCTFSGNTAEQGGAVFNGGNMKLENVVLATESDTVYNSGSLAFAGVNELGAAVVNDGKITFSLTSSTIDLISDLGAFSGSGTYLVKLSADVASEGAAFASGAGTFTGSLSVKLGDVASTDAFTLDGGIIGNDLAIAGDTILRLEETGGALTVKQESLEDFVPAVSNDGSILAWNDSSDSGYWIEIAQDDTFDAAIRIATDGTAFDVAGASGDHSGRVTEAEGEFTNDSASWMSAENAPRQLESNGNGRADVFFASVDANDVWTSAYQAKNTITGETAKIAGKNRIRDTFSGSESDANILYLSDAGNGDALFMDDIYSEYGEAARINLIREIRAGAGADVVDMTSERYTAELAGMTVRGGAGNDVLWGADGGNMLFGDEGRDLITGGTGDDLIAGGTGSDVLTGGGGNDLFTFGENWGTDTVSQSAGGTVALWFLEVESQISAMQSGANAVFLSTSGASVTVKNMTLADLTVHYGDDGSAQFAGLAAAGAFLGGSSEAIFETESARQNGILASL